MSIPETLFLVLAALVLFGPKKLPEIARQLGKIMGELRRASAEFRFQIEDELRATDEAERRRKAEAGVPPTMQPPLPQPPMPQPPEGHAPVARNSMETIAADGSVTDPQPPAPEPSPAAGEVAHG